MSSSSNAGGERSASRTEQRSDDAAPGAKPDFFYGDRNKVDDWLNQMRMHLFFKKTHDQQKTMVAITYLRGRAQHWMKPETTRFLSDPSGADPKGMMLNFEKFAEQLKMIFGASKDAEGNAAVRIIQSLKQKGSASDYTSRFKEHMPLTGWDDEALRVMYRNGLKDAVKDELMRSSARTDTLPHMIREAIRIDDMLYERQMEKRHIRGGPAGYSSRGGTGGYNRDRGDPMELDATIRGKPKRGKGKGNKKGGIKCYSCGKLGHMKKDCRTNKVRRQQINMMQVVPTSGDSGRGAYDTTGVPEAPKGEEAARDHGRLSWTACYDDSCNVHLSDKQGSGWFPTRPRRQLNVIERKPLQQKRDGGNRGHPGSPPLLREATGLQENQEPGNPETQTDTGEWGPTEWEGPVYNPETGEEEVPWWQQERRQQFFQQRQERPQPFPWERSPTPDSEREPSDLDLNKTVEQPEWEKRMEQAQILATTQDTEETLEEEPMIEESEPESEEEEEGEDDDNYTWTVDGPAQLYQMIQLIAKEIPAIFVLDRGRRLLHPTRYDMLIDKLRSMFWNHEIVEVQYDYARIIVERPPLGSQFQPDGSYVTPDNLKINKSMRQAVLDLKARYVQAQTSLRELQRRQAQNDQLGTIPDCNTSEEEEESENDEAPDAEAAEGSF